MEGEECSQLDDTLSDRFRQELCRRRGVVPEKPLVGERGVVIQEVFDAPAKAPPNIRDGDMVSPFFNPLPDTLDAFLRIRNPEEMELDLIIAPLLRPFKQAHVRASAKCGFERECF